MERTQQANHEIRSNRHFQEQSGQDDDAPVEVGLTADGPLEVNMTDEPGGDPYNHTGRFKRLYR